MKKKKRCRHKVFRPHKDVPRSEKPISINLEYDSVDKINEDITNGEVNKMLSNIRLRNLTLCIENKKMVVV